MGFNCVKPLAERQHSGKPHPLDCKARLGCDPARILKRMLDKAIAAGLKRHDICHYPIPISSNANGWIIRYYRINPPEELE